MRQKLLLCFSALAVFVGAGVNAQSQVYPNKPIRMIVGFAPGGSADISARFFAEAMSRELKETVVVENKGGAGGNIAAAEVARSEPDGYTILLASPSSISVNPALNPKLTYKASDLLPVTKVTSSPIVIAAYPGTGINNVKELIAKAKQDPGGLNYSSSGNGSAPHLAGALFGQVADVKMTHIPFRGGSLAIQSVIAGDTQLTFGTPPSVLPMIQAGRLKGLAISAKDRSPLAPGLPGMKEAGLPDYAIEFWYGLFVPAGTPPAIVQKLFEATQAALKQPNVKASLAREGTDVSLSSSPAQFGKFLAEDEKFWVNLVKSAGVSVD